MEEEIWKPVPSMPGLTASSHGRIKLPEIERVLKNGIISKRKTIPRFGSITWAAKGAKHLYFGCMSRKLGNIKVHRAVCEAFHGPPPFERAVVIHINENGLDNRPKNLQWGTQKENLNAPGFIEYCKGRVGENSPIIKGMKKNAI